MVGHDLEHADARAMHEGLGPVGAPEAIARAERR